MCKEDSLVAPYNLEILLFWGASMNLQRVSKHGFEMYLANIFQNQNLALMYFLKTPVIQSNVCVQE